MTNVQLVAYICRQLFYGVVCGSIAASFLVAGGLLFIHWYGSN